MNYLAITVLLFIAIMLYFRIANHFNIIDKPNHRSSHTAITLRGGGIIIWVVALLYFLQNIQDNYNFFISITIVSLVSFWDDIISLSNRVRISAHFLAISIIFFQSGVFKILPVGLVMLAYVLAIGIINAYNFMDGINGITGLYTLTVLGSLLYINQYIHPFIDKDFIIYPILATFVFLFYNFRKKARCFAGDVGSIAIAIWIIYLLTELITATGSLAWILLLGVYGVDTVCTIIHRLYLKQNIFEAHRLHFYQVLTNEYKYGHRLVSVLYALTQLLIATFLIRLYQEIDAYKCFVIVLIPLVLVYCIKFYLLKNKQIG